MFFRSLLLSALCLSCVSAMAQSPKNCEPLRSQIEKNLEANGVREFSLMVVSVDADVAGKVVGRCAQGRQKIMYLRGAKVAKQPSQETAHLPGSESSLLIACKDGTVTMGGLCKP